LEKPLDDQHISPQTLAQIDSQNLQRSFESKDLPSEEAMASHSSATAAQQPAESIATANNGIEPSLSRSPSSTAETRVPAGHGADRLSSKDGDHDDENDLDREDDDDGHGDHELGGTPTRVTSTVSIAETLPLYRELLFVTVICLAQLFTREFLNPF
jgi:hypothetical protein